MKKWWNNDDKLEQNLLDWFGKEDLSSWLTSCYEILVKTEDVYSVTFCLADGECSWNVHYSDHWDFPAGSNSCKTVYDILIGFESIMKDPDRYRQW